MRTYYRIADGASVPEEEAVLEGLLRDGYGVRLSPFLRDSLGQEGVPAGYVLDGQMLISDSQAEWEERISCAWRGADAQPQPPRIRQNLAPYRHAPVSQSQEDWQRKLANAWRNAR